MTTDTAQVSFNLASWTKLAKLGSATAVSGLAQMVNKDFAISALSIEEVSIRNATRLVGAKADDSVIAIYLLFSGNTSGQILLSFDPQTAFDLVDMALDLEPNTTKALGEMERSVLGEMGNIVGAFFLNSVADCAGLRLMPSPPTVMEDNAGRLVGSLLAEAFKGRDSIFVIKLKFHSSVKEIEGNFLVLPSVVIHTK